MIDANEFFNRVKTVAGLTEEESTALLTALKAEDPEKAKIEGDIGKSLLTKKDVIASVDFLLNDKVEKNKIYKKVMSQQMPDIEKATMKVYLDSLSEAGLIKKEDLERIWADEKNERINQKVFHANKTIVENAKALIEAAKVGDPELAKRVQELTSEVSQKQSLLDELPTKHEAEKLALQRNFETKLIAIDLVGKAAEHEIDIAGLENEFANGVLNRYHLVREGGGN